MPAGGARFVFRNDHCYDGLVSYPEKTRIMEGLKHSDAGKVEKPRAAYFHVPL